MKVLCACEESQAVCKAFRSLGRFSSYMDALNALRSHVLDSEIKKGCD